VRSDALGVGSAKSSSPLTPCFSRFLWPRAQDRLVYRRVRNFFKLSDFVRFRKVGAPVESPKTIGIQRRKASREVPGRLVIDVQNLTPAGRNEAQKRVYRPKKGSNVPGSLY